MSRTVSGMIGHKCRVRVLIAGLLSGCCAGLAIAEEPPPPPKPPTLTHLFPPGGQRGSKVVAKCAGEFSWPAKIWAPGVEVAATEEEGKIELTIPKNLPADRVWIRLYNDQGASAALPFLIGGLEEIEEQEPNNSLAESQRLAATEITINGVLQKNGDVDGFAVELIAGQALVAAVDANTRLGSPMDAILQVATPDGTVVMENHDAVGLDPRVVYIARNSGTHIVRIFAFPAEPDTRIEFRGGDNYIYRLTLTAGPFITHAVPLSVSRDEPGIVEVRGWNIPPGTRLPVIAFGGTCLGDHLELEALADGRTWPEDRIGLAFASGFAGAARVRLVPHATDPNIVQPDEHHPVTLTVPTAVTGCLRAPRKVDVFNIAMKKGQQAVIAVESQNLDLPLVPLVRLADPSGTVASEVSQSGPAKDALLTHTAAQDGEYQLTIRDRFRGGGDRYFYRLTIREEASDFELSASADAIVVNADKPAELPVKVTRRAGPGGAVGPIHIEAMDLPPEVTAPVVVSEVEGETAAEVKLVFSTTGCAYSGPIRIRGTAEQPRVIERLARTPPKYQASFEHIWLTVVQKPGGN